VKLGTAWLMKHKLMRAMAEREAAKPKLAGRVEIDDTYLGGERSGGTVVSDGLSCWPTIEKAGCEHRAMRTGSFGCIKSVRFR
jgi:hypothetical protein